MTEDHPIWLAIDTGGGQTCDIAGVLRELNRAGYVIVPKEPTDEMLHAKHPDHKEGVDGWLDFWDAKEVWEAMIGAAPTA